MIAFLQIILFGGQPSSASGGTPSVAPLLDFSQAGNSQYLTMGFI
jgi:hypothetical protein